MNNLLQKLVLGTSAAALVATMPVAAFAQDDVEQVVVSASRISIAGYTAPTPVTVVGAAQLQQAAYANIEDSVRQLPQLTTPPSNFGSNQGSNSSGGAFLNLRFLGVNRTLVLLDGQRVVTSPISNGAVDVTTLPQSLISRVDVVTGGASATWGSDAVAGVVNFVLNKNFTGFKATIQASDTTNGRMRGLTLDSAWGSDIFGGRGHVEVSGSANFKPDTVLLSDERWFRNAYWVSNPAYVAGNGQPQLIVANNIGNPSYTPGGIINTSPAGVAGPGVVPAAVNALRGIEFVGGGTPQLVNYGNLTSGNISNGGSLTQASGQQNYQLLANPQNAYTLFGYGRYKLTSTIQASLMLNYGYTTAKTESGVSPQTALTIKSDNAYIPASVRSIMQNGGITSFALGTANVNNLNTNTVNGQNFWQQASNSLGPVVHFSRRNIERGVFTLEGTLGDDWSWNAYYEHGSARWSVHDISDPILSNLNAAEDAVTVTSANVAKTGLPLGSIACRSTLTGTAVVVSTITAQSGCIPLNVFGSGVVSPAAIGYITGAGTNEAEFKNESMQQDVAEGQMSGVLPWQLPAGKVAVAFGMGYRKEQGHVIATPVLGPVGGYAQDNYVNFPSAQYNVLEGFAEVDAPILKDKIVNDLNVQMAGRMTSYSTSGLVETWKLGATSQVNDDIKLRTTWSVDIRAPQVNDLFSPGSTGVTTFTDPKTNLNQSANTFSPGNPNLQPEVARTISGGAVLTPTFIPGLTFSADWYSINLKGVITAINATTIVNQCNPSKASVINPGTQGNPNDPLCTNLLFNGPGGALSGVFIRAQNLASQTVSGLDLAANYNMDFMGGTLAWATNDNYTDENTLTSPGIGSNDFIGSATPLQGNQVTAGPKWKGVLSATYDSGPYSVTVQSRWYGSMVSSQTGNTGNQSTAANANLYDPAHFEVPVTAYLDLRANYKWNDNISFYGAVDNALDTPPPLVANLNANVTVGSQIWQTNPLYDTLGRVFRVGMRLNY